MKTGIKIALVSFLCVLAQGQESNATVDLVNESGQTNKAMLGMPVEVIDKEDRALIENFVKASKERSVFEEATLKRIKALYKIKNDYKQSEIIVKSIQEVAENPEPFIVDHQIELLDKNIKMYKSLNMMDEVKMCESIKERINNKKGMK